MLVQQPVLLPFSITLLIDPTDPDHTPPMFPGARKNGIVQICVYYRIMSNLVSFPYDRMTIVHENRITYNR